MAIDSWFPTHIYFEKLQKNLRAQERLNGQILRETQEIRTMDRAGQLWSEANYANGFTSYASVNNLHLRSPTFAELAEKIDVHVARFAKYLDMDLGRQKLQMTTCWVNIMPANTHHGMHLHPLSVISGTYYVKVPKGASGLKIEDPRLSKFLHAPPKRVPGNARNRQFIEYIPEAGKLILFESWLRHEVPLSRCKSDRISISFNYSM